MPIPGDVSGSAAFRSARQWELAYAGAVADWLATSGLAERMLADACAAVDTTVSWLVEPGWLEAGAVLAEYPNVLSRCDELKFNDGAQALAYLVLHLPDRFSRMFLVLERLLALGHLPLGRSDHFAAIDIGAGPGPGIFAIRAFYAGLARYAALYHPSWPIAPLGHSDIVERSTAMPWVMHQFAEALVVREQNPAVPGAPTSSTSSSIAELERSSTPFGARYTDFSDLDIRRTHNNARRRLADEFYEDEFWDLTSRAEANRMAYTQDIDWPSGYALAIMMNFLTSTDAIPLFSDALERLMRGSLVPGGVMLVLGGVGGQYPEIYAELDDRARAAGLQILPGFKDSLQAGSREYELRLIRDLMRGTWSRLEDLTGDVPNVQEQLNNLGAADIFDESATFRLPRFKVRAYKRGR